jgi:5-carboxymethyl-2-hydroxymuconate isomerase
MPDCILEYSANVPDRPDVRALLAGVNATLAATGPFTLADIKSRAVRHEEFVIGDGDPVRAFATLTIEILAGRNDEAKARISEAARAVHFDSDGHVIVYAAAWSADATALTLASAPQPGAPGFRLTYRMPAPDPLEVSFDAAPPGSETNSHYVSDVMRRAGEGTHR